MKKYFAVFTIPADANEKWKAANTPEQVKAGMEKMMADWKTWVEKNKAMIADEGKPLGKTKRIDANGVADIKNDLCWYMVVEADSFDAAAAMFKDQPHLIIPGASVDLMEIPENPGM